jgi:hypothetical protein
MGMNWLTKRCADQAHATGERKLGLYRCWNRRIIRARGLRVVRRPVGVWQVEIGFGHGAHDGVRGGTVRLTQAKVGPRDCTVARVEAEAS